MRLPARMTAIVLTGYGGFDKLAIRHDVPVPSPGPGEVLIRVGACGVNNTDINTRLGWYAPQAKAAGKTDAPLADDAPGGWSGALSFPRIQGADVAGHIVAVGRGIPDVRLGERVIVEPLLRDPLAPIDPDRSGYLGSERDGGFAQFLTVPAVNAFPIASNLTDAELATFPCSYSTAENMLTRIRVSRSDTLLITGASGGVGSALVQLAKRRGAKVIALTTAAKADAVAALGADQVIDRESISPEALNDVLPEGSVNAVADVVGGGGFAALISTLKRGGRYVAAGAIAGPMVSFDLRQLYLKDLQLHGATVLPEGLFGRLVGYIERGEIRPIVAGEFPLAAIREVQTAFLAKTHIGSFVLKP